MLYLEGVTHSYDNEESISHINLNVEPGESVVVLGPSGSGKSTLLKVLAGLLKPQSGTVKINGNQLESLSELERKKTLKKMGMLFQKNALFDSMTAIENVSFPMKVFSNLEEMEIIEKSQGLLNDVDIGFATDLYPDEMSGGMQKRLGIARALGLNPEIVFYDDPTAGLDPITSRKIVDLIIHLKSKHRSTIVTVTNDMNRAYQLADKIVMMVGGKIIFSGDVQQIKSSSDQRVQQFIHGYLEGPLN